MCVALALLEARVHVSGASGDRVIAFADFHRLPGDTPQRDTNLDAGEIITAVELPPKGFATNYTYLKIRDRLSYAFALVSVAVGLELEGDIIKEGRFALGGVAHKPWRDPQAEAALRGQPRQCGDVRSRGGCAAARRQGLRAQHLQDRSRAPLHLRARSRKPRAARRSRSRPRKSSEDRPWHLTSARPHPASTASRRSPARQNMPPSSTRRVSLHGSVVTSTITKGRITRIDTSAAKRVEGRGRRADARKSPAHGRQRQCLQG